MIEAQIFQPMVALMIWTMVMWVWMYATRIPAMQREPSLDTAKMKGTTGAGLRDVLPDAVNWKADNYNHLHEAPTLFYAVAFVLALIGQGDGLNALLAWMYAGLRIIHSLVQVTANRVMVRFVVFTLSSLVLMALILHAAIGVFH